MKLSFGTDAGVCDYGTAGRQFAFMVKFGMTPMQAIQAATRVNAQLLQWDDRVGSIEPGKLADLIAVPGDPLRNLALLEQVPFVMLGGKVVRAGDQCLAACAAP